MKYKLTHRWTKRWDGRTETGPEFGWGDWPQTKLDDVCEIEADNLRSAQSKARQEFKDRGLGRALFSGVGYTAALEEVK